MSASQMAVAGPSIRRISVAFLGPRGTYSHQAARAVFAKFADEEPLSSSSASELRDGENSSASETTATARNDAASNGHKTKRRKVEVSYVPCSTITEAFGFATAASLSSKTKKVSSPASSRVKEASDDDKRAKESGEDEIREERYAVVPIVNSSNGPVKESMACFGLTIQDEPPPRIRMQTSEARRKRKLPAVQKETGTEEKAPTMSEEDFLVGVKGDQQARIIAGTELAVSHALMLGVADYQRLRQETSEEEDGRPAKKRAKLENGDGQEQSDEAEEPEEDELKLESLAVITEVASHEQALGQCSQFLTDYLPKAKRIPISSTALSAEQLSVQQSEAQAVSGTKRKAAGGEGNGTANHEHDESLEDGLANDSRSIRAGIASKFAAETYGIKVARRDIQNANDNTTRFICVTMHKDHVFLN